LTEPTPLPPGESVPVSGALDLARIRAIQLVSTRVSPGTPHIWYVKPSCTEKVRCPGLLEHCQKPGNTQGGTVHIGIDWNSPGGAPDGSFYHNL